MRNFYQGWWIMIMDSSGYPQWPRSLGSMRGAVVTASRNYLLAWHSKVCPALLDTHIRSTKMKYVGTWVRGSTVGFSYEWLLGWGRGRSNTNLAIICVVIFYVPILNVQSNCQFLEGSNISFLLHSSQGQYSVIIYWLIFQCIPKR